MGFSSALQGRAAHEALLVRLDAEIRLMEIMKRSILLKAKFDKEYAINLAAVAQQGLKWDRADDLQGSLITKSWRSYMDDLDHQAKQFKSNAELLEVVCEKMSHLSQDKRKARKAYQEEHTRIAAHLNHLTDEVVRKKSEYQKHLEGYKALRTRFEEHYIKSGRSGRKLDDVRDKYQKACRKLHLTHNEYVMLIAEAIEVEKDFRTVLLPGLLEHQQSMQESFILLWKNILQEAVQYSDLTADKFKDIQRRIELSINSINPGEEYREFTERHKTSPASPLQFQFDETLLEDIPGKLQSNTLTVDNLTVDWLRTRLNDLEIAIKDCQEKQEKMVGDLNGTVLHTNGGINGLGKDTQKQSKDLNSLRCQEKQKQKLAEMIKSALSEVGCEELPSGCDDHLAVEQNFIENNFNNEQPGSSNSTTSLILQRGAGVMSLLRGPFKRKSTPLTPTSKQRNRGSNLKKRSQSLGSLSVNSVSDLEAIAIQDNSTKLSSSKSVLFVDESTNTYADINNTTPIITTKASNCDTNNSAASFLTAKGSNMPETYHNEVLTVEINRSDSIKSSIDAQLDKIDKINRILDENMRKPIPDEGLDGPKIDYDAITEAKTEKVTLAETKTTQLASNLIPSESPPDIPEIKSILKDTRESSLRVAEDPSAAFTGIIPKRRSTSFSNRSINSILSTFKEMSFTRNFSSSKSHCRRKSTDSAISASSSHSKKTSLEGKFHKQASKRVKYDKKLLKSKKSLRSTFRSRLKMFNSNKSKLKCEKCSKRKIHPSKSVADFKKEFHTDEMFENEFCVCTNETTNSASNKCEVVAASASTATLSSDDSNVITIKEHDYCEAFGMSFTGNRPLYEEEWFHGVLPREEVVRLLKNDGDFLVRETIRNEESQIVLSVSWNGHKHFIVQTTADGHYRFEGPPFPSIQELIMHQYQSELPVTVKSGAILRRPVMRERWELSNDDVILLEKIGRGNFGDVYKAKLKSTKLDVAVKTCRMTLPDEQKRKFLQEGRILKQYDHPNIVKLIGICVQKQPIMIVMELVPGGSLLNFLRKSSNTLNTKQLMGLCKDAAAGMRYLESKNCIHRDLAARNCLIDLENTVKISDFGMSREEEEYIVSDGMKQIPVKWTAPEALNFGKYTSLCDVWSYGILMWEIFSKGDTPYSGMSNSRARERIDTGYRMPAPENTPPEMYRLMLKCWAAEPESRPHFDEIYTVVEALMLRE